MGDRIIMEYFPCTSFGIAASTSIQSDREVKEKKHLL